VYYYFYCNLVLDMSIWIKYDDDDDDDDGDDKSAFKYTSTKHASFS